jgi:hypothetical protein
MCVREKIYFKNTESFNVIYSCILWVIGVLGNTPALRLVLYSVI